MEKRYPVTMYAKENIPDGAWGVELLLETADDGELDCGWMGNENEIAICADQESASAWAGFQNRWTSCKRENSVWIPELWPYCGQIENP